MALTAANVQVAITGGVYVAPTGTTAPTDESTALNAAFIELGYVSEDGITESWDDSVDDIFAWQNATNVRSALTQSVNSFSFTLIESNGYVMEAYHRGSTMTEPTSGKYKLDVKPTVADPQSWVFQIVDGSEIIRVYVGLGEIVERGEVMYRNGEPIGYPCTLRAYPDSNGNISQKFSNIAAWTAS